MIDDDIEDIMDYLFEEIKKYSTLSHIIYYYDKRKHLDIKFYREMTNTKNLSLSLVFSARTMTMKTHKQIQHEIEDAIFKILDIADER